VGSFGLVSDTGPAAAECIGEKYLVHENDRLHGRNLEAFAAAHVLAHHDVVLAQHVRARLCKSGAVALIGSAGDLALLSPHQPGNFVFRGLLAARTVQVRRFLFLPFVEKLAFFHSRRNLV
jgi:hypothetical protein